MPTAAKLFAALAFGFIGFFAAELTKPAFPEDTQFGWFTYVTTALGIVLGWRVAGRRAQARGGMRAAVEGGLVTSFAITFWTLMIFSIVEMLDRAIDKRFNGVFEALLGIFRIMLDYAMVLTQAPMAVGMLLVGGVLGGILAGIGASRFR